MAKPWFADSRGSPYFGLLHADLAPAANLIYLDGFVMDEPSVPQAFFLAGLVPGPRAPDYVRMAAVQPALDRRRSATPCCTGIGCAPGAGRARRAVFAPVCRAHPLVASGVERVAGRHEP